MLFKLPQLPQTLQTLHCAFWPSWDPLAKVTFDLGISKWWGLELWGLESWHFPRSCIGSETVVHWDQCGYSSLPKSLCQMPRGSSGLTYHLTLLWLHIFRKVTYYYYFSYKLLQLFGLRIANRDWGFTMSWTGSRASSLYVLSHLILTVTLWASYDDEDVINGEMEAQRG